MKLNKSCFTLASLGISCLAAIVTASLVLGASPDATELFRLVPKGQDSNPTTCGYSSCPQTDPNKINVHLVAHSHDDVGWLKTVDQYFYGTRKRDSQAGVQFILDSLIPELLMDKDKRFIYVEMSFFSKWWFEQNESMKSVVRKLVQEGRLEFINGGWCMNDEATVTYQSTIEQMTLGLKFLQEQFGPCAHPKSGWQIDPFGHTNEQASLFAQFGFDGMYFTRISQRDKYHRTMNKSLDIIWHGDRALSGQSGSIFTNIFRDGYDSPQGFCFDALCYDDFIVDNKKSYAYNADLKVNEFIKYVRTYAGQKLTNHVLIPIGGDFHFTAANQNFKALDKLLKYVRNNAQDLNIFYSTPSCYQYSVYQATKQKSIKLQEKYDDFMPYESSETVWWSGYFSSRPSVKLIERELSNLLPVARLVSFSNLIKRSGNSNWVEDVRDHESKCLMPLWEILGDLQHHDAVTGTEKQHVSNDYVRRAFDATALCSKFMGDLRRAKLDAYVKKSRKFEHINEIGKPYRLDSVYLEGTQFCPLLNISECNPLEAEVSVEDITLNLRTATGIVRNMRAVVPTPQPRVLPKELTTKSVLMNIYNPLARPVNQFDVRIPCNCRCDLDKIRVIHLSTNETMKLIRLPNPSGVSTLPFRNSLTNYEVLFYANLPALGYTSFVVEDNNTEDIIDEEDDVNDSIVITDETMHNKQKNSIRSRRLKRQNPPEYQYIEMNMSPQEDNRPKRDLTTSAQDSGDRVIVKFEMSTGTIVGLKRVKDGSVLNITQKFGYYFPANADAPPGAYIFRPNSTEPVLIDRPKSYKLYKRRNGALIEIHQKWTDWIWQTIRVDAKKNYIEFDYVVGPIPVSQVSGLEVVTRYITSMSNKGVFMTDSNGRQLLPRHRHRSQRPENLGGSFFPVVSTIMLRDINSTNETPNNNSVDAVAILVDRSQAGTSLHDGQIELLIHRRMLKDDHWGVEEPLNEPGEDGRGLVTRGKHRLYLKFREEANNQDANSNDYNQTTSAKPQMFELPVTPRANLQYERFFATLTNNRTKNLTTKTFLIHDRMLNELRQESVKQAMRPVITFDRLRVGASDFIEMVAGFDNTKVKTDLTLINVTLPANVHLLTLQPWTQNNSILIRVENLDNPLTLHPFPDFDSYKNLHNYYLSASDYHEVGSTSGDTCVDLIRPSVEFDIEYLLKRVRIVALDELNLGADVRLRDEKRLNWTDEVNSPAECNQGTTQTSIKLSPRQIRTFLATFELI